MSFRKSIRWRIQSWYGMLLLAMTLGFGVTVYRLERTNALRNSDQELRLRIGVLTNILDQGGKRGPGGGRPQGPPDGRPPDGPPGEGERRGPPRREGGPPGFEAPAVTTLFTEAGGDSFYYVVWARGGQVIIRSGSAAEGIPRPERAGGGGIDPSVRERDGWRECFIFTPPGECLLVGRSTEAVDRDLREFVWQVTGAGTLLLACGLGVGWWISTRALKPIAQISAAATRIADGHLKERIRTEETESELGKLAALLDDTFQRLDAAFDEQARFTSDAAHELRTPVSIILAQTQLALSKERGADAYKETIGISRRAALRMQGLTEALLQLAVLDSEIAAEFITCDLGEIAKDQIELTRALAGAEGISMEMVLEPAHCRANETQVGQVMLNLLSNAVKFSGEGTTIRIRTGRERGSVFFSVADEGPGIAAAHLPHLFQRFYRAEASRSRDTGGAGLGLAICKRIAEAHGGEMAVESVVGKGSVFTLRLAASAD